MKIERSFPGAKGVDTVLTFSKGLAERFKAAGYAYVVRYLGALTDYEVEAILAGGLALLAVSYSRRHGWLPNGTLGAQDGMLAVQHARAANLPIGLTLFCDLEGPGGTGTDSVAYVNAWAHAVQAGGYIAGLYVGYGIQLTAQELYSCLAVTAYWDSCSKNPDVAKRGFQMVQEYPPNKRVCGLQVDTNVIQPDFFGDTPVWVIAGDPARDTDPTGLALAL